MKTFLFSLAALLFSSFVYSQDLISIQARKSSIFIYVEWTTRCEPDSGVYLISRWSDASVVNVIGLKEGTADPLCGGCKHIWMDAAPDSAQRHYSVFYVPKDQLSNGNPSGFLIGSAILKTNEAIKRISGKSN